MHLPLEKWISVGSRYKEENGGHLPPFEFFTRFICYQAQKRNDPSFALPSASSAPVKPEKAAFKHTRSPISVHKTNISSTGSSTNNPVKGGNDPNKSCPIHSKPHPLRLCKAFRAKSLEDRRTFLKERGICFKCCSSTIRLAKNCTTAVKCPECDSTYHDSAMHPSPSPLVKASSTSLHNGREGQESNNVAVIVDSNCMEFCGTGQVSLSCFNICLATVYHDSQPDKANKSYVILDDRSNWSLARSRFFELFSVECDPYSYYIRTCSGTTETSGQKAEGFMVESLNGKVTIPLPPLIECNNINNNQSEIPTPNAAIHHPHLVKVAEHISEFDPTAEILLLLGRDLIRVHKVWEQDNVPHNTPFTQRLYQGWVLVGGVWLRNAHKPTVSAFKTTVLNYDQASLLQPCTSFLHIKEKIHQGGEVQDRISESSKASEEMLGWTVFDQTQHDNKLASSIEDEIFLELMDKEVCRNESHIWVAPLPFKQPRRRLPNNWEQAVKRFSSLQRSLNRRPEVQQQYVTFMGKILENNHAEVAPPVGEEEKCWYHPAFEVFHPQNPGQIRVVVWLKRPTFWHFNDVLLTGPDLNNSLLGVLIWFRKGNVAILADIQQELPEIPLVHHVMEEVIDYRMKVHVFGNSLSPTVAIYRLRSEGVQEHGADTVKFVECHFYFDDGLCSVPTNAEAVDLLPRTQTSLAKSNLPLHKFASNSQVVLDTFPPEDCAVAIKDVDLSGEASLHSTACSPTHPLRPSVLWRTWRS